MKLHESGSMSLRELADLCMEANCQAFAVQYYRGRWRASIRTPDGIPITVDGPHMITAMRALVDRLRAMVKRRDNYTLENLLSEIERSDVRPSCDGPRNRSEARKDGRANAS